MRRLRGRRAQIDSPNGAQSRDRSFFESLAEERVSRAIGVILSGTGTDGTVGLRAIKAAGGLTFAQSEESAKFDAMPRSDSRWFR